MAEKRRGTKARRYRPKVEALEALRLLSDGLAPGLISPFIAHQAVPAPAPVEGTPQTEAAWDAALGQTRLAHVRGMSADPQAVGAGLAQLDRYLARAWARAGIPPQQYDDCTQAVYAALLQNLGRDGFDRLVGDVGQLGVREVLSRETPEGPDFFRAVDMVKKRAQRERTFQTLDERRAEVFAAGTDGASADWRGSLHEAIGTSLTPREAALIRATLQGQTPAEIAAQWGVAPKTVSNEKTRALQKLRDALVADMAD